MSQADGLRALDGFDLTGQTAIVTGGAHGIGRATCELLAAAGAAVVVADRDGDAAAEVADGIARLGRRARAVPTDVSDRHQVDALFATTMEEHGRVDILCNVAGVYARDGHLVDQDEAEIDRLIAVNLKGTIFCCQAAVRAMRPRGQGAIVNVASSIIDHPVGGHALYALTKAGVATMSRVLADEVGSDGIRVNVVAPGVTLTDFVRHNAFDERGNFDPERFDEFLSVIRGATPLRRIAEPIDQAYLILYLVSPAARCATGNTFRVNGGMVRPA